MRVLVFGTFDPLHAGHVRFLRQARILGDSLLVVVARDSVVRNHKGREPFEPELKRLAGVSALPDVDEVILGDAHPERYELLATLNFDVLALGYDQEPDEAAVQKILDKLGKQQVRVVRLKPHQPNLYKSSLLRKRIADS